MDNNLYNDRLRFLNTSFGTTWGKDMNISDSDVHHGSFWNNNYYEDIRKTVRTPWDDTWAGTMPENLQGNSITINSNSINSNSINSNSINSNSITSSNSNNNIVENKESDKLFQKRK